MSSRLSTSAWLASLSLGAACSGTPAVPEHPTWADVAPVIRGECAGCHGSTALATGGGYRLDFYEMTTDVCGDAAQGIGVAPLLAGASATRIAQDLVAAPNAPQPRMPPAPAPPLADWERQTLLRWAAQPSKGPPPAGNRPPEIAVGRLPATASDRLTFTAVVDDPDGEAVVGVLKIADVTYQMNRSGSFAVDLDTSTWPAGVQRLTASLCDGWIEATYDLGPIKVQR